MQDPLVDIIVLSTQKLVHMQRVTNQELVDREKGINGKFLRSQEKEVKPCKEIEALQKEKEWLT